MSTKIFAVVLIATIISSISSLYVPKTNARETTGSVSMSMKAMGSIKKAFAAVTLSVVFTADISTDKNLFTFIPPAAHARGMNGSNQ